MTKKQLSPLFLRVVAILKGIPKGRVATYGQVAKLAGINRGARQVSWILKSSSKKYKLPWHRVIGSQGKISLPLDGGYFEQKRLLEKEGVLFAGEKISLENFSWKPDSKEKASLLKGLPAYVPKSVYSK